MLVKDSRKNSYELYPKPKFTGGEGQIFEIVGNPKMLVKIYHEYEKQDFSGLNRKLKKLIALLHTRPQGDNEEHFSWPLDAVYVQGQFIGFLMKKLEINALLFQIYEYNSDIANQLTWTQKVHLARNMCVGLNSIHNLKQVIGDFNPQNIAVNMKSGYVYFLDNDSFHLHFKGVDYPCIAGVPEYLPPEIQIRKQKNQCDIPSLSLPTFTQEGDRFSLAIHIFRLLMNGVHPYHEGRRMAKVKRSISAFRPHDMIVKGNSVFFNPLPDYAPPIYSPDVDILPPSIQKLFRLAFVEGHLKPSLRPTAMEWYHSLKELLEEKNIGTCAIHNHHNYWIKNKECPWCASDRKYKDQLTLTNQTVVKQTRFVRGKKIVRPVQKYSTQAKTPNTFKYNFMRWASIIFYSWVGLSIVTQGFFPELNIIVFSWPGQIFYFVAFGIMTLFSWLFTVIGWIFTGIGWLLGVAWEIIVWLFNLVVFLLPIIFDILWFLIVLVWDIIVWIVMGLGSLFGS
jgi:DNA-binding helix-hairpin-helix protein with protein kinase domain